MGVSIGKNQTFGGMLNLFVDPARRERERPNVRFYRWWGGYTGEQLREIRKRNGVGRPPAHTLARLERQGWAPISVLDGGKHGPLRWARVRSFQKGPAARRVRRQFLALTTWKREAAE